MPDGRPSVRSIRYSMWTVNRAMVSAADLRPRDLCFLEEWLKNSWPAMARRKGEGEPEGGAVAGGAVEADGAALALDEGLDDVQAEPEAAGAAALGRAAAGVALEDAPLLGARDPRAAIAHAHHRPLGGAAEAHDDGGARAPVLGGVHQQVDQHLLHPPLVPAAPHP